MVSETEEAEAPTNPRRRLLIGLLLLVISAVLLFGLYLFGFAGLGWIGNSITAAREGPTIEPRYYVRIDDILTRLNLPDEEVFINLTFVAEFADRRIASEVEMVIPEIRDVVLVLLREMTPEEIEGSAGAYRLREAIGYRVNRMIEPARVEDIYFEHIQVQ